jgi:hypothetical protein
MRKPVKPPTIVPRLKLKAIQSLKVPKKCVFDQTKSNPPPKKRTTPPSQAKKKTVTMVEAIPDFMPQYLNYFGFKINGLSAYFCNKLSCNYEYVAGNY